MKRKDFITGLLPLAVSFKAVSTGLSDTVNTFKVPPYIKAGDTIGITSPAGFISIEDIQPAVIKMQEWGFKVKTGNTIGKRDFSFGGTDEERLNDMQVMLDDRNIKAIMCARGGYGVVRIIDKLDFKKFSEYPKWIIGFSDITVMHSHIHTNLNIASLHSKMCNSFPFDWNLAEPIQKDTIESIRQCLTGEKMNYSSPYNLNNKPGIAKGPLVGGNLTTFETITGSSSNLDTKDKILFVEDTGEYLYSIDRMFWNMKRTGKLSNLAGLIIGGFKIKADDAGEEFGRTLEQIVLEKIKEYNYPVCFDFPVGHQKNNYALKCGVVHTLHVTEKNSFLSEI